MHFCNPMLKVGVIGAGDWGKNHIRIYTESDCKLIGIADSDKNKKQLADSFNIEFFSDYKQLLSLIDAVSVVVPTNMHYNVVKYCLSHGKHVLVEKPITNDSKSAMELFALAKNKNLVLAVGYLFRFNSAVNVLKEEIKNIGNIQYITGRFIHSNKPPRKDSGVIFNFGIHLVDILNYILGTTPKSVFCKRACFLSDDREDVAFINMDYGSFIANLEVSWFHPLKERDFWIIGTKAKIYADLFEQIVKKYPLKISYEKTNIEPEINLEVHKNEPLKDEIIAFLNDIENRNRRFDNIEEEILTTKICELALESAKTGKEMFIE